MHTASLELCKELYRLSGWNETDYFYQFVEYSDSSSGYTLTNPILEAPLHAEAYPAYDLGYLLRKFPSKGGVEIRYGDRGCLASSQIWSVMASTPEDAACKLAIELYTREVLKHE
jgi:hypothetical protein